MHSLKLRETVMFSKTTLDSLKLPFWECRLKLGEITLDILKDRLRK